MLRDEQHYSKGLGINRLLGRAQGRIKELWA